MPTEGRHNTSAPTEPEEPDSRVHAAWLAQVSKGTDGPIAKQGGGSTNQSTSSLGRGDHLVEQEAHLARSSRLGRRPGFVMMALVGFIFALVLAVVIAIPQPLSLFESWRQPRGDRTIEPVSSESLTSATPVMRNEPGTPKLIVQSSRGVSGEPAPIKLAVQGADQDAFVIIKGLVPGMELSSGAALAGDTWQLAASDLPYAWIAPPQDFVGSVDIVAELHLPNAQIVDRRTIRLEWTRPAAAPRHQHEREQSTTLEENEATPSITPPAVQHPNNRDVTATGPPISVEPSQVKIEREQGKSAGARGKNNLRRSVNEGNRRAPLATLDVGDSRPAVKGFWDWSR